MTPKHCPECGADPFKQYDYDKMQAENMEVRSRFKSMSANHGLLQAQWTLKELGLVESMKSLQRKVGKQATVIKRLEEKLRKLGKQPYKEEEDVFEVKSMAGETIVRVPLDIVKELDGK